MVTQPFGWVKDCRHIVSGDGWRCGGAAVIRSVGRHARTPVGGLRLVVAYQVDALTVDPGQFRRKRRAWAKDGSLGRDAVLRQRQEAPIIGRARHRRTRAGFAGTRAAGYAETAPGLIQRSQKLCK